MSYRANVITFAGARLGGGTEKVIAQLKNRLEECRHCSPDLICFPECVLDLGGHDPNWPVNNQRTLTMMQEYARELHTNIVVNLEEVAPAYPDKYYNTAYVIDRSGEILTQYRKRHITFRSIAQNGLPGERIVTVDTDIGRIGLSICFDLGWRDDWKALADAGAQIVVWPSAYHGGNLLNAYAAVYMYYIVSSTWGEGSRIIDPLGHTIAEASTWDPSARARIYPGAPIIHFDHHETLIPALRAEYGDRLHFRVERRGNIFEMASEDPTLDVHEVMRAHNMQSYQDYHTQYTKENADLLTQYPDV